MHSILLCTLYHFNHSISNTPKHTQTDSISNTPVSFHIATYTYWYTHIYMHIKIYIQVHIIHTYPFYFTLYTLQFQPLHFKHTQTHSISNTPVSFHTAATYHKYTLIQFYSVHYTISTTSFQTHLFSFIHLPHMIQGGEDSYDPYLYRPFPQK